MSLTGFVKSYERKRGGVKTIALIPRSYISGATFNASSYSYTALAMGSGKFSKYEFEEDQASFEEVARTVNGMVTVTHEISFSLECMGGDVTVIMSELLSHTENGVVALVTTNNNAIFVVGYSEEFKNGRPLRVASMEGVTGKKISDSNYERVVLRSEDVAKSRTYMGSTSDIYT